MPAEFPRIKLQLYDYGLTGDTCLGEAVLNIKNTIMLLEKQGNLDLKKVWTNFTDPNKRDESAGYALISI